MLHAGIWPGQALAQHLSLAELQDYQERLNCLRARARSIGKDMLQGHEQKIEAQGNCAPASIAYTQYEGGEDAWARNRFGIARRYREDIVGYIPEVLFQLI